MHAYVCKAEYVCLIILVLTDGITNSVYIYIFINDFITSNNSVAEGIFLFIIF